MGNKLKALQNFGGANKVYYGGCENGKIMGKIFGLN